LGNEVVLSSGAEQPKQNVLSQIRATLQPVELLLLVTGALTLLGTVVLYFAAARQIQLMVWVDDATVYPSQATHHLSLPLSFGGTPAKNVRFATIRVANVGASYIGEQQSLWKLHLTCPDAQSVVVLGSPTVVPSSTVFSLLEQATPNVVSLALGVLESRAELTLSVMVVNLTTSYILFKVSSSLPGVPEPIVGASLWAQFGVRFLPLVAVSGFIIAGVSFARSARELLSTDKHHRWRAVSGTLLKHILAWVLGSFLLMMFLGFVAACIFRAPAIYEAVIQWRP
jgi:hypothetical protein